MLPLSTTTITVKRPADGDPYETASEATVATGVAAHISSPTGADIHRGGQLERVDAVLLAEASLDLVHTDEVVDDGTAKRYRVAWVRLRQGLALDHLRAGLTAYDGAAAGG